MDRYRHPRLVGLNNRGYLAEGSMHARQTRMAKLREAGEATAATRIASAFEEIVRAALARVVPLSDNRVLAYEEAGKGPGYVRRHRELDAVLIGDFVTVFEIKATRSETAALRGIAQLRKAGTILRSGTLGRTRGVALVLVWVDTGSGPAEVAEWLPVENPDSLSRSVDAVRETERACLVRISAPDAWAWRRELGVVVQDILWEDYEAEAAIAERRRALTEAGVDPSNWPADLSAMPTATRWQARDETAGEDSTMAAALRQALKPPAR